MQYAGILRISTSQDTVTDDQSIPLRDDCLCPPVQTTNGASGIDEDDRLR